MKITSLYYYQNYILQKPRNAAGSWLFGQAIFVQDSIPSFTLFFGCVLRLVLHIFDKM